MPKENLSRGNLRSLFLGRARQSGLMYFKPAHFKYTRLRKLKRFLQSILLFFHSINVYGEAALAFALGNHRSLVLTFTLWR